MTTQMTTRGGLNQREYELVIFAKTESPLRTAATLELRRDQEYVARRGDADRRFGVVECERAHSVDPKRFDRGWCAYRELGQRRSAGERDVVER